MSDPEDRRLFELVSAVVSDGLAFIETETGDAIPAVKLATEYLGMAVQAVSSHPEFLDPNLIDERLLLGRTGY